MVSFLSYLYSNCFEITVELSCCKYPNRDQIAIQWRYNEKSLIRYLQSVNVGIKGIVSDENNNPVKDALIRVLATLFGAMKIVGFTIRIIDL